MKYPKNTPRRRSWIGNTDRTEIQNNGDITYLGEGSMYTSVKNSGTLDFLNSIIEEYNITSINDAACGIFENWQHELDLAEVEYAGFDIVPKNVAYNKEKYPEIDFYEFDIVAQVLPKADLIIARDIFFHLSNEHILRTLAKFEESSSTYMVATYHAQITQNSDAGEGYIMDETTYLGRNLEIAPFNLGPPILRHVEPLGDGSATYRHIGLWKLRGSDTL